MRIRSMLVAILVATVPSGITGCIDVTAKADASAMTGPSASPPPVDTTLSIPQSSVSLVVGPSTAVCTASPPYHIAYATNPAGLRVTWTSSNQSVATVDASGVVTGHAPGTSTVFGALTDKPSVRDSTVITVIACAPVASGIRVVLLPFTDVIPSGCSLFHQQPQAQVLPVGTSQALTYSVTPAGIINVDGFGLVSAASPGVSGSAILTARSLVDPTASASITVVVANLPCPVTSSGGVNINVSPTLASGLAGQTLQLTKTVQNSSAAGVWTSSDSTKVKVNQSGLATFVAVGSTHVCYTISTTSGCALLTTTTAASAIVVTINAPPKGTTMHVGDTQLLSATTNAADPTIDWLSSAAYWCDVNIQTGILTAKGTGTCIIYASLRNNPTGASAGQITVNVIP